MRKNFIFLFLAAILSFAVLFSACGKETVYPEEEKAEKVSGSAEEYVPLSENISGKTAAYIFMDEFLKLDGYTATQTGKTYATAVLITVEQKIFSKKIKVGGEVFFNTESNSSFVKTKHQALFSGDKVAYRNAFSGEISSVKTEDYRAIYGITPDLRLIEGFVINEKTVLSSEISKEEDGTYEVHLMVDGNVGGFYARTQMKETGDLNGYPDFKSVNIYLTLNSDYTPVKTRLVSEYSAKQGIINAKCEQALITEYSAAEEIPYYTEFSSAINS